MPNSITASKKPKLKRLTFHNPSKKCALSLLQTVRPLPSSTKVSGALPPAAASTRKSEDGTLGSHGTPPCLLW